MDSSIAKRQTSCRWLPASWTICCLPAMEMVGIFDLAYRQYGLWYRYGNTTFDWDTTDHDAIGLTEPTVGWRQRCYENEDYLPERLDCLLNAIEDKIEEFWKPREELAAPEDAGTGLCAIETRVHPGLPPLGQDRVPQVGVPAPKASEGLGRARPAGAAYELVAFFTTVNVSPANHKADTCASCEEQLYAMWSDPPRLCAYDPDLGDASETWLAEQGYRATIEASK
eukprot:5063231-Pyramimonas_sp.AAC.1